MERSSQFPRGLTSSFPKSTKVAERYLRKEISCRPFNSAASFCKPGTWGLIKVNSLSELVADNEKNMEGATDYRGCVDSHHEERPWLLVSYSSSFHFPTF